jgi:excisionase family DNA binding protein
MLTLKQAAELAGVSRQLVDRYVKQGRLAGAVRVDTPIGSYWQVPESSVRTWMAGAPARGKGGRPRKADD